MNSGEMERLAKAVARETVAETFLTLGLDIKDPVSVQGQFAFLRNLYYGARHVRNLVIAGVVAALVTGGAWVFWSGFKASVAAPISSVSAPLGK